MCSAKISQIKAFQKLAASLTNFSLVLPLSISKLSFSQDPINLINFILTFINKNAESKTNIILAYTDSLYMNKTDDAFTLHQKIRNKVLSHIEHFQSELLKQELSDYCNIHFFSWAQLVMHCKEFRNNLTKLTKLYYSHKHFQRCVQNDIGDRQYSDVNVNFVLEEALLTYYFREQKIDLSPILSSTQRFLLAYDGPALLSDYAIYKFNLLSKNLKIKRTLHNNSVYNIKNATLVEYEVLKLTPMKHNVYS